MLLFIEKGDREHQRSFGARDEEWQVCPRIPSVFEDVASRQG